MSARPGDLKQLSRFLSLVLRHAPQRAGVSLDAAGWVEVDALLRGAAARGRAISRPLLDLVVAESPKQRFAYDEARARIRAVHGHSVDVDLGYVPSTPPEVLFHGTCRAALAAIRREGLKPMSRRHVHLSPSAAAAEEVGARRGPPIVLEVDAGGMHAQGIAFRRASSGVWLCDRVPADRIAIAAGEAG